MPSAPATTSTYFNPRTPRGVRRQRVCTISMGNRNFNPRTPRGVRHGGDCLNINDKLFQSTHPARGATHRHIQGRQYSKISIHAPREGCDSSGLTRCAISHVFQSTHPARGATVFWYQPHIPQFYFNPRTPRGVRRMRFFPVTLSRYFNPRTPRGVRLVLSHLILQGAFDFNPRTPRGVRQQTLPKSREFAWLNLLICTRGRRLSIRKQTRLCSMKLSFMLFGCEPAGEGVSSWTSHATKSKVRLEGRSAYSQSVRSSAHSDFPGNKSGGCPVRDP